MPITLTFGAPTQLLPANRDNGVSAHEDPLDRENKTVMKSGTAGGDGMWIQQFNPVGGWQPETQISTQTLNSDGQPRHDYNKFGDTIYVFAKWDGGAGAHFLTALWHDGTGAYTDLETRIDAQSVGFGVLQVCPTRWGITAIDNASRDFIIGYCLTTAGAIGEFWTRRFNGTTRTWDAAVNHGQPNAGGVYGPIVCDWQPIDGTIHWAIGAVFNLGGNNDLFYRKMLADYTWDTAYIRLTTVVPAAELMFGVGASEMDAVCDRINSEQFYIVATHWTNGSAQWVDCDVLFFEKDLTIVGLPFKTGFRVSEAVNRGAHFPNMICDTNGDLWVVWAEHDTGGTGFRSVWARQREYPKGIWETRQKVADSNYETSAGAADPDPEYPGIVRPPRFKPLKYLCVTWGDKLSDGLTGPFVYVNCALVRDEEDFDFSLGSGGLVLNHDLRMLDIPAGSTWWRSQGKENP